MSDPLTHALDRVADAECDLEEANESGDLEDRMEAALALAEAQEHLEQVRAQEAAR